jgi:organic radical activating enzyme
MKMIPTYSPSAEEFLNQRALRSVQDVPSGMIPVSAIFETIEGEGTHIGTPRVLARVSGCAVMCGWCDTKYTWNAEGTKHSPAVLMSVEDFCAQIMKVAQNVREVSITGGEPMHYIPQMHQILDTLNGLGYLVSIETSGLIIDSAVFSKAFSVSLDIKTPSSGLRLTEDNIQALIACAYMHNEVQLKAVVQNQEDLDFLQSNFLSILQPAAHSRVKPLVVTPCADNTLGDVPDSALADILNLTMAWNKRYHIRIIAQQHKLLDYA